MPKCGHLPIIALIIALPSLCRGVDNSVDMRVGKHLTTKELPPPVQASIEREMMGGSLRSLSGKKEHGKIIYRAIIAKNGSTFHLYLGQDGGIVWRDDLTQQAQAEAKARISSNTLQKSPKTAEVKPQTLTKGAIDLNPFVHGAVITIEQLPRVVCNALLREADGKSIREIKVYHTTSGDRFRAVISSPDRIYKIHFDSKANIISCK